MPQAIQSQEVSLVIVLRRHLHILTTFSSPTAHGYKMKPLTTFSTWKPDQSITELSLGILTPRWTVWTLVKHFGNVLISSDCASFMGKHVIINSYAKPCVFAQKCSAAGFKFGSGIFLDLLTLIIHNLPKAVSILLSLQFVLFTNGYFGYTVNRISSAWC